MCDSPFSVQLPEEIFRAIEARLKDTSFATVEDFVIGHMKKVLGFDGSDLSPEDEEKVKERLKALGYMD